LNTPERGLSTAEPDQIYIDVFGINQSMYLKAFSIATIATFASLM
jgi:hypothetical protein